jgi:hypothetical protein
MGNMRESRVRRSGRGGRLRDWDRGIFGGMDVLVESELVFFYANCGGD